MVHGAVEAVSVQGHGGPSSAHHAADAVPSAPAAGGGGEQRLRPYAGGRLYAGQRPHGQLHAGRMWGRHREER